jgi:DNA glycosylase AlkZ-like
MADKLLTRRELNRATLARQMLLARENVTPVAAVERLAGMQAQLARPPFVGLWSRIEGFTRDALIAAVERRAIVRGTLMRGTIHLMSRRDFVRFRQTLQPALSGISVIRDRVKGVEVAPLVARARVFFEPKPRTFAEFRDHLTRGAGKIDERALAYLVRLHLPLLQVPAPGATWAYPATADFAVADAWLGEPLDAQERPEALAERYLAAFGPATANDFRTWSALPDSRAVLERLRPKLVTFRDERKRELFDLPKAPRPDEDAEAPVRFLPEYDNLLLAHVDRSRVVADEHRPRLATRNLLLPATFLVDGMVAGTWTVTSKRKRAEILLTPFVALAKSVRLALTEEGERLARFVEPEADDVAVTVSLSPTVPRNKG